MLSDLMAGDDFLLLRERVVARAIASPPQYSSLAEFLHALQYYARPNGRELVQAVYTRATQPARAKRALPVESAPRPLPLPVKPAPPAAARPAATPPPPAPAVTPRAQRSLRYGTNIANVILLSSLVWLIANAQTRLPEVAGPELFAVAPVTFGPGHVVASRLPRRVEAGPISSERRLPSVPQSDPAVQDSIVPAEPPGLLSISPLLAGIPRIDYRPVIFDNGRPEAAPIVPPQRVAPPASPPPVVFSDAQVVPPRLVYPQSLDLLPPGSNPGANVLEVVINEDGLVETVRAVRAPTTIGEFNAVVSGASITKSWRFQPATVDGRPVKYRMLISLSK
jgi:hypothetical protein